MITTASVTGLFRTLIIIIGVYVILKFLGQLLTAKRNLEAEKELVRKQREFEQEKRNKIKNFGKTKVIHRANTSLNSVEDVDFEEIKSY